MNISHIRNALIVCGTIALCGLYIYLMSVSVDKVEGRRKEFKKEYITECSKTANYMDCHDRYINTYKR